VISSSPHIDAYELRRDNLVDVAHSLEYALPAVYGLVTVAELQRLVDPRGRPAGHRGAVEASVPGDEVDLDGGVPAAVHDLPRADRSHRLCSSCRLGRRQSGGERRADGDGAARWSCGGGEEGLRGGEHEVRVGHVSEAEGGEPGRRTRRGFTYMAAGHGDGGGEVEVEVVVPFCWVGRRRRGGIGKGFRRINFLNKAGLVEATDRRWQVGLAARVPLRVCCFCWSSAFEVARGRVGWSGAGLGVEKKNSVRARRNTHHSEHEM
jgi:hypothetical protein